MKIIPDLDRRAVEKDAVEVDEGIPSEPDVIAIVAGEDRFDHRAGAAENQELAQERRPLVCLLLRRRIVPCQQTLSLPNVRDEFGSAVRYNSPASILAFSVFTASLCVRKDTVLADAAPSPTAQS